MRQLCRDRGWAVVAVVERKTLANLATSLSDGRLAFQTQQLAEVGRDAVVVEGEYCGSVPNPARSGLLAGRRARPAGSAAPRASSASTDPMAHLVFDYNVAFGTRHADSVTEYLYPPQLVANAGLEPADGDLRGVLASGLPGVGATGRA